MNSFLIFLSLFQCLTYIILLILIFLNSAHHLKIYLFHFWKRLTKGKHLWLRNNGSTLISQLVDTILFITLTFSILPSIVGIGIGLPLSVIVQLILGQYLVKLLIALADTPLIYAFFSYLKKENLMPS